ncbi:aldo/keto reductase [Kitasatospora terrestris]|uniref:Aldo/keto reductase n=1 Tax=Kitasatospora terrestris TaxID=258051 RepID=A0ABP9DMZ2_9ACTN
MRTRFIGTVEVGAIGYGAMPLSIEGRPDEAQAISTVHAALDAGITLLDTADSYHWHAQEIGHNEELLARALRGYGADRSRVLVATKGGRGRPGDGSWTIDGRPEHLRRACEGSLRRLGVEAIGLYQLHHPDRNVPWAESVGAVAGLLDEGKVRAVGISNADAGQIREAHRILGPGRLVSVQNEYSPAVRGGEAEIRVCEELGLAYLPWGPLGGIGAAGGLGQEHAAFREVAERHGVSPQRVCLAWLLAKSPAIVPIPGARRPETVRDSAAAAELHLDAEEFALLDGKPAA